MDGEPHSEAHYPINLVVMDVVERTEYKTNLSPYPGIHVSCWSSSGTIWDFLNCVGPGPVKLGESERFKGRKFSFIFWKGIRRTVHWNSWSFPLNNPISSWSYRSSFSCFGVKKYHWSPKSWPFLPGCTIYFVKERLVQLRSVHCSSIDRSLYSGSPEVRAGNIFSMLRKRIFSPSTSR